MATVKKRANKVELIEISFDNMNEYKRGAVTYKVTTHFCPEAEPLKAKVGHLIISHLQKYGPIIKFAENQESDV